MKGQTLSSQLRVQLILYVYGNDKKSNNNEQKLWILPSHFIHWHNIPTE